MLAVRQRERRRERRREERETERLLYHYYKSHRYVVVVSRGVGEGRRGQLQRCHNVQNSHQLLVRDADFEPRNIGLDANTSAQKWDS